MIFLVRWDYTTVAVICHGNLIRFFLSKAQGKPPEEYWNIAIDNTSITTPSLNNGQIKVVEINDVSHL